LRDPCSPLCKEKKSSLSEPVRVQPLFVGSVSGTLGFRSRAGSGTLSKNKIIKTRAYKLTYFAFRIAGNIPKDTREKDLERFFRHYGRIRDILVKPGYGFVEFDDYR
jgi:RNA recognition motif-containing protein